MLDFIKNIFKRKSPAPKAGDYWIPIDADTKKRAAIMGSYINATMHKEFIIPTNGLSPMQAEQEIATLIADYKDHVVFDEKTGGFIIESSIPLVKQTNDDTVIRYLQDNKHNQA